MKFNSYLKITLVQELSELARNLVNDINEKNNHNLRKKLKLTKKNKLRDFFSFNAFSSKIARPIFIVHFLLKSPQIFSTILRVLSDIIHRIFDAGSQKQLLYNQPIREIF